MYKKMKGCVYVESFSRDKLNDSQRLGRFQMGQIRSIKFKDLHKHNNINLINIWPILHTLPPSQIYKQNKTTARKKTHKKTKLKKYSMQTMALIQPLYIITTYARSINYRNTNKQRKYKETFENLNLSNKLKI